MNGAVSIDPAAAAVAVERWHLLGRDLAAVRCDLGRDVRRLALDDLGRLAVASVAAAAERAWTAAADAASLIDRAVAADAPVAVVHGVLGADAVVRRSSGCSSWSRSPLAGDLGGTFGRELGAPFVSIGRSPVERGRSFVARALSDAASDAQLRPDEFGLVELGGDRFVVVLPGVVDLTSPALGLDDGHRSVRDLDRHAVPSARSTAVADNRYAQMVIAGLAGADVPAGAELVVVGHSFGADTALDLAADDSFNGAGGFRVSHVVAAGYFSDPQLPDVTADTRVLVLQNHRDAAVIAEAVGQAHVLDAAMAGGSFVGSLLDLDPAAAVAHGAEAVRHGAGALWDGGRNAVERRGELAEAVTDLARGDVDGAGRALADAVTRAPRVAEVGPGQVLDVFEGGGRGAGHHPANYVDHVSSVDDPLVEAFFASLDAAGVTGPGVTWAIDVSVPHR